MKTIAKIVKGLSDKEYYIAHLKLINSFIKLEKEMSEKQISVLASFMSLKGDTIDSNRFGTDARKIVMEQEGINSGGLGNYLRYYRDNGLITKVGNGENVIASLWPEENNQVYKFLITKNK